MILDTWPRSIQAHYHDHQGEWPFKPLRNFLPLNLTLALEPSTDDLLSRRDVLNLRAKKVRTTVWGDLDEDDNDTTTKHRLP